MTWLKKSSAQGKGVSAYREFDIEPDLIPTPVAGTPSASKSPHPDRFDPDRAEPGHCRMLGVHRVEHVPARLSSPREGGRRCLEVTLHRRRMHAARLVHDPRIGTHCPSRSAHRI